MATIRMTAQASAFDGHSPGYPFENPDRKSAMVYPVMVGALLVWDVHDTEANRTRIKCEFPADVFGSRLVHVSEIQPLVAVASSDESVNGDSDVVDGSEGAGSESPDLDAANPAKGGQKIRAKGGQKIRAKGGQKAE